MLALRPQKGGSVLDLIALHTALLQIVRIFCVVFFKMSLLEVKKCWGSLIFLHIHICADNCSNYFGRDGAMF